MDGHTAASLDHAQAPEDSLGEPFVKQLLIAQFVQKQAHLTVGLFGCLVDLIQIVLRVLQISGVYLLARSGGKQRQAVKRLRRRVMQISRQTLALLQHRQLLTLPAQYGIFNSDAKLIGDGSQQFDLLRTKIVRRVAQECQ